MEPLPKNQSPNWNQDSKPGRQSRTPKRTIAKRCKKKTNTRTADLLRCLGRAWLTFRPSLTHVTEIEQTRHFYSLFAQPQHCLYNDVRMKIESSTLPSSGKELIDNSTVRAEQFYRWSMFSRNYKKKKELPYSKGGGGQAGVRECAKLPLRE